VLASPDPTVPTARAHALEATPPLLVRSLRSGGELCVWRADLDAFGAHHDALLAELPDDERARAAALPDPKRRERFVRARGVLRRLLGEWIGASAARLPFAYGDDGKPSLAGAAARSRVRFNLSHARSVALVAIAADRRVGVDLAWTRGAIPVDKVIARFFSAPERLAIASVPDTERRAAFARIWVRKEAYLKGRGEGISEWIYQTDFSWPGLELPARGAQAPGGAPVGDQAHWHVQDLDALPDHFVGSVALERERR
jgi:4'-phosphopantetheinyl transferase